MNPLRQRSWSPYVVGALIGVLSWFTFGVAQKAIGVSTNFSQAVRLAEEQVAPEHAQANRYHVDYRIPSTLGWEAALLVGLLLGAFISARLSDEPVPGPVPRLWGERFGPSRPKAYLFAFLGGLILMYGARLAGGCTSGHGISGALQLAVSSWTFFLSLFVGGLITAFALYGKGGSHV
jgi:uncharacterized membrane protein YedE/YeeE